MSEPPTKPTPLQTDPTPEQKPGKSCLGVWLMVVMVIGMLAWTVLVVAGYFHHGK